MPEQIRGASLNAEEAAELVEAFAFLGDWFAGADQAILTASLARFVGTDGYDLARYAFLLGGSGDELVTDDQVTDDQQ